MFNSDMSSPKPTLYTVLFIFAVVLITVPLAKYFSTKVEIPGLSPLIRSV